jgi:hypothetical protein
MADSNVAGGAAGKQFLLYILALGVSDSGIQPASPQIHLELM